MAGLDGTGSTHQGLSGCLIAANFLIGMNIFRVNFAAVRQDYLGLVVMEIVIVFTYQPFGNGL